jgi:TrmH family RNA methyltransferase
VNSDAVPSALSPQNPRVVRARGLLDARGRREHGRFLIEGPTLLAEARASELDIETIFVTAAAAARGETIADAEAAGIPVYILPDAAIARLSDHSTPPGLVAVAALPARRLDALVARPGPVLLLAGVGDPGNAGTLIRSAEALGAAGVLVGHGGVDPWAPKVVRGAMGSLFRLPVVSVSAEEALDAAAAAGRPMIVADFDGEPLWDAPPPPNAVIAIGNERRGVRAFLPRWDRAVRIEQREPPESLNAAVAGAIILYRVSRRM